MYVFHFSVGLVDRLSRLPNLECIVSETVILIAIIMLLQYCYVDTRLTETYFRISVFLVHRDSKIEIYTADHNLKPDKLSQPEQIDSESAELRQGESSPYPESVFRIRMSSRI